MEDSEEDSILEAEQIYVLMEKDFRLSRNTRAQWYFNHLDSVIRVSKYESIHDFSGELDVVSVVPKDPDSDWDWDIGHLYSYRVNSSSMVQFLAQRYRLVYLLDLSPSSFGSAVFPAFKKSLQALVRPFYVPGSQLLLKPDIYVTVIAWTPFLTDGSQQVLKQGFLLTSENLGSYLSSILDKLKRLGLRVSELAASAHQNIQSRKAESERIMGHLFEEEGEDGDGEEYRFDPPYENIPVATPEAGFINMIRTGILALQLLPKLSSGGIIVVTDGIFSIPDMNICDSLLNQLRSSTISLSFLQVTSAHHPHAGYGRLPYVELMEFFSCATYGTYLPKVPEVHHESYVYNMNIFHEAFLCWSFRKALEGLKLMTPPTVIQDRNMKRKGVLHQGVQNTLFKHSDEEFIVRKTLLEATMQCRLSSLLSVRLREGYTLNTVHISQDSIQVQLTLPWKIGTYIHYTVQSPWPQESGTHLPQATVLVYVEGFYDTLHDIICRKDTVYTSHDRNNVTRRFYVTLQNLAHVDKLLCHIESFKTSPDNYTVPEALLNNVPLFYIPPNSTTPVFYREEFASTSFGSFWKPINFLDINIWHRWMHTNRIHIMLQHDYPLPRHLFLANSSGRYTAVHCRKAALKLFEMLKNISTFVLLENNSYVQFIKNDEDSPNDSPSSFYVVRITSKPPCVVIWLAFPSGASAIVRHRVHHQLLLKIDELRIKQNHLDLNTPIEIKGTTLLLKPVERILVRYNKIPSDFFNLLEPAYSNGTHLLQGANYNNPSTSTNFLQTSRSTSSHGTFLALARYLHHKRWVWCIRSSSDFLHRRRMDGEGRFLDSLISGQVLARILNTLAKSRLLEGFTFAHSHLGVQNLALELPMRHETKNGFPKKSIFTQQCVVQYVIFPPHTEFYPNRCPSKDRSSYANRSNESFTDEEEEEEEGTSGEIQIITEVWVEPQDGVVEDGREERQYLNDLKYRELPDAFFQRDKEIISTLLSFEHLVSSAEYNQGSSDDEEGSEKESSIICATEYNPFSTISYVPYSLDLITVLEKSSSVEILFSMFIQDLSVDSRGQSLINERLYEKILAHLSATTDKEYVLSEEEESDFHRLLLSTDSCRRKAKESWLREDSYGKWRVFVKVFSENHVIVSLLPESYEELTHFMLVPEDEEEDPNSGGQCEDQGFPDMEERGSERKKSHQARSARSGGVCFIKKPIEEQVLPNLLFDSSAGSSTSNLMNPDSTEFNNGDGDYCNGRMRMRSSGSDRVKHQSSRDRAGSLEAFCGNGNDSSMRLRTFSMDSKRGGLKSSLLFRPQTNSAVQPPQNGGGCAKERLSAKKPPLWGALCLPVLMYDVSSGHLVNRLLKEGTPKIKHSLINNTFEYPEGPPRRKGMFTDAAPLVEGFIRNHAASLQSSYAKAYVSVLFDALQNLEGVHTYDVLNALKLCDKEIFQSIDAKDFVDSICTHEDDSPRPCHSPNHVAIKKKFLDILCTNFHLVPGFKDLYFFYSSPEYHETRRDTLGNDAEMEVASSLERRNFDVNPSLSLGAKCRPQNSSLGSIMSNESSHIHETQDDFDGLFIASHNNGSALVPGLMDHQPLFIQIFANHCRQEIQANGPPLSEIPTCWMELIGKTDEEGSYNPKDLFSIHFVAIYLIPFGSEGGGLVVSSVQLDPSSDEADTLKGDSPTKIEESLSTYKYTSTQTKALENVVEEIQWMMRNEIIYSMTRSPKITEDILKKVTEHIAVSVNKPGCAIQRLPLSFVFKPEESMKSLIARFESMELLSGYGLIREGQFYYIVQDIDSDTMNSSSGSSSTLNNNSSFPEEHQRFQLSPVKEVSSTPNKNPEPEPNRPSCWLIVFIGDESVSIFFQYREGQLSVVLPWRQALASLSSNVKAICRAVNQEMLLMDLFDSRFCHRLLESDTKEESSFIWSTRSYFSRTREVQVSEPPENSLENIDLRFKPGYFSCPVVWSTTFCLHPRLKHLDHQSSRGIKAIKLKLSTFQVQNRLNMFVYMDENDKIYYISVRELSSSSACPESDYNDDSRFVSRASSFSSCAAARNAASSTEAMDNISQPGEISSTNCAKIELKVQGLCEPGEDIKVHLVATLEKELNEQVIEVISEVLLRNPRSKLSHMDVFFLQPPTDGLQFSFFIPPKTTGKRLSAYLRQNLTSFTSKMPFIEPKYASNNPEHQFRDQESGVTYIYTKCGKIGRHRGIGVIKIEHCPDEEEEEGETKAFHVDDFLSLTSVSEENLGGSAVRLTLWEKGDVSIDRLKESLRLALVLSLWDYHMETEVWDKLCGEPQWNGFFTAKEWLDYGSTLDAASVFKFIKRHSLHYSSFDLLKEIRRIVTASSPEFSCRMFYKSVDESKDILCINGDESRVTGNGNFYLIGHSAQEQGNDSYYRKFQSSPQVLRRDAIVVKIQMSNISFRAYNISKGILDEMSKTISNQSHWMTARSCLTTSIVSQKLGIFHNSKFNRAHKDQESNPFLSGSTALELLIKNKSSPPVPEQSKQVGRKAHRLLSIYRDAKPPCILAESPLAHEKDPTRKHGRQMLQMRASDNKEMFSKLYFLWQNPGESSSGQSVIFNNQVLRFFKKSARLVHYCLTPLLFLPHWRSQAHSTRLDISNPLGLSIHRRPQAEERSHVGLIQNYIQEYIQYLHTLGFIAIPRKSGGTRSVGGVSSQRQLESRPASDKVPSVYLQKSLPGGLLIFEIGVIQPFFSTKLYVMEYTRLVTHYNIRRESNLVSGLAVTPETLKESFTRKLLDECDNIKHLIHVHSFTYDYHLRTTHNFISGRPSNISKGFHLSHFIDDFLKYYNKGPNFARNMVHSGSLLLKTPTVCPKKLYNYLLSHEKTYDLKVLRMEPLDARANENFTCDYLLVRQSSSLSSQESDTNGANSSNSASSSSSNNPSGGKATSSSLSFPGVSGHDDYDFVLLLINDDSLSSQKELLLKYYIILTSKRDLYPTYNVDKTRGKFRTVLKNAPPAQQVAPKVGAIQRENVNYVGFYSSREQSMEKIMSSMILATETMVVDIFERAMVHCRRDQLWSRLLSPSNDDILLWEFNELLTLVDIEAFEKINDELESIVSRPLSWFKSLMKLMATRYPVSRFFGAPDDSVQHLVLQDTQKCVDSCILITMDTPNQETSLNIIFKEQSDLESVQSAIEDFVSICLCHIWSELL